jgi:hypothetical protein
MLHAHPQIAIPPETRFTLLAYDERRRFGDLTDPANMRRLATWMTERKHNFHDLGLDRDAIIEEIVAGAPTIGSAASVIFKAYAARFGKPRWGDKRPAYILNLDVIMWMFPDAQVIHIIRDGRDCVASMKEAGWYRDHLDKGISRWARGMAAAERARRILPANQFHELYYEDLVAKPEVELRRLCDFLGEEYVPEMAEPARMAAVAIPERKVWHALAHGEVTTSRIGSWRERLTPQEIGLCESVMGRQLRRRGYEVSGEFPLSLKRRLRYMERSFKALRKRAPRQMTIRMHRMRRPVDLAARPVLIGSPRSGVRDDQVSQNAR